VPELTQLQTELLSAAVEALAPGGVVAYVTCSPHLAETAGVVAEVERRFGTDLGQLDAREVIRSISGGDIDLADPADGSGRAQLWPHRHATDAMSIWLRRRT
jgi:16S rRNA (cytosine967-C5)-methyltransferase